MCARTKYIYRFAEGDASMKSLLGGKGANLAQMMQLGLPVPPGFIISTEACNRFLENPNALMEEIWQGVQSHLRELEKETGKRFDGEGTPLLVSVRSGAAISMPGMMDTVLNLGLNDQSVQRLADVASDERFAYDSYRRFIQMFSDVVLGIDAEEFDFLITQKKRELQLDFDYQMPAGAWKELIEKFKTIVKSNTGSPFPMDPWDQLYKAIEAVFNSWNTQRAYTYRNINKIPHDLGTAVNIVSMVFGNLGNDCGTGVCFTRNPSTGEPKLYGEFLINAQGEDVVAGIRNPEDIQQLSDEMPEVARELTQTAQQLESYYKDVQDIEFTVERGKLYLLQTRNAKRTARAAVRIAVDMLDEGVLRGAEAVHRVTPTQVEQLLHKQVDPDADITVLAKGLPASPGAAVGKVVFDPDDAKNQGEAEEQIILVRPETTPDDIHGLFASQGVLTSRGGMTSHAAVVARGLGKPCVSGCDALEIDLKNERFTVGETVVKKGETITIDGTEGTVMLGEVPLVQPSFDEDFRKLLREADKVARLQVWANADTPDDAAKARDFGAVGIGLCRTEHMFMAQERLPVVQRMIMADRKEDRITHLNELEAMQTEDFTGIFRAMEGFPVTVRLLDPPLHEFLPDEVELREELHSLENDSSADAETKRNELQKKLDNVLTLQEANPMLGFRGCRLGIIYPEIYEMQVRAVMTAACTLHKEGRKVIPDIMLPLIGTREEMRRLREAVEETVKTVLQEQRITDLTYLIGTMIEVPRAALVASELAEFASFFSFGTNDLTQTTFGYSRDDAEGKFLAEYVRQHVLDNNPFHSLDVSGVGRLMQIAVEEGRQTRKDIQLGICGEHGGDPDSITFCHQLGLDYVSCSPFRVPVARLAAAQAAAEPA
ncbi:MAG: pyruvate, phosphate dikinase [Synergistales bacterium]|nr:pyruvate, phosphate dikinase [Synergistales bacterium]